MATPSCVRPAGLPVIDDPVLNDTSTIWVSDCSPTPTGCVPWFTFFLVSDPASTRRLPRWPGQRYTGLFLYAEARASWPLCLAHEITT